MTQNSTSLALPIALALVGAILILWATRRLLRRSKKAPMHVQVYEGVSEVFRKDPEAEVPAEALVCYRAYRLYLYLLDDGLDKGVSNMEPAAVRDALPALEPLGLGEAAREIDTFVGVYEEIERRTDVDESLGEEYQKTARDLDRRLYPLLREIPERLEQYLGR
ncbi:hypothetical protein [Celeribacter naphthalenivorans]|uniref:hypothetical protein n=1 Tax=Celeribacter naphthalenivorans TaxID=1614694 RepID=UPI001CFA749D|nr:hypothetical protein [Celeribacter naphthalenivorans]